ARQRTKHADLALFRSPDHGFVIQHDRPVAVGRRIPGALRIAGRGLRDSSHLSAIVHLADYGVVSSERRQWGHEAALPDEWEAFEPGTVRAEVLVVGVCD